jgi:hypothetical protein
VMQSTPGQHSRTPAAGPAELRKCGRDEFPYHWDADDLVSRRELLQFAVYASGALFASTAVLAVVSAVEKFRQRSHV